jgi:hypothetical protein
MQIGMGASQSPRRRWTSGEEHRLQKMLEAGNMVIDIAAELERTPSSIYSRSKALPEASHPRYHLAPLDCGTKKLALSTFASACSVVIGMSPPTRHA